MTEACQPPCAFCAPDERRVFLRESSVVGLWDGFPVSPGHALLIPIRHVLNWFEATIEEKVALVKAIDRAKLIIDRQYQPDGYNIGVNCGSVAGQTVFHMHVHLIPRYRGDVLDPRGGVRHVIPSKANYSGEGLP
jgi:diadenosine tetraphosphate (Ap4A) HIT family hydrolase